jgi:hypothetical protein
MTRILKRSRRTVLRSKMNAEQQTDARVVLLDRGLKIDIVKVDNERRGKGQLGIHRIFGRYPDGKIPARIVAIDPSRTAAAVEIGVD